MFNVGDEVEVIDGAPYSITIAGSRGTVVAVYNNSGSYKIEFTLLTSARYGESEANGLEDVYTISFRYLKLTHNRTKEENILYKINQMSTRFDKRKNKPSGLFEENLHAALHL